VPAFQITSWRDLPSLVVARDGDEQVKVPLPPRFQEAIDEAAMRQDLAGSAEYLEHWRQGDWEESEGSPDEAAAALAQRLDEELTAERLDALLEG